MDPPVFLTLDQVLVIHRDQVERYGGSLGVRDRGLLESALATPKASFGSEFLHADVPSMAGAYLFHIAHNHPFLDGNKRVAAVSARVFLLVNGWAFDPPEEDFEAIVLGASSGNLEKELVEAFVRRYAVPPDPEA